MCMHAQIIHFKEESNVKNKQILMVNKTCEKIDKKMLILKGKDSSRKLCLVCMTQKNTWSTTTYRILSRSISMHCLQLCLGVPRT